MTNLMLLIKPLSESFDLLFCTVPNLASSLKLCSFQCFCLTLSRILRINDAISSIFVFILLFYCVFIYLFSSQHLSSCIISHFQHLPYFTICRLLGSSYFQFLSFPFAFNFNICDMPFFSSHDL